MGVFISCTFTIKFIRSDLMAIFFSLLFDPTQVKPPALSKTVERCGLERLPQASQGTWPARCPADYLGRLHGAIRKRCRVLPRRLAAAFSCADFRHSGRSECLGRPSANWSTAEQNSDMTAGFLALSCQPSPMPSFSTGPRCSVATA